MQCGMGAVLVISFWLFSVQDAYGLPMMQCRDQIIKEGDSKVDFSSKCGEPDQVVQQKRVNRRTLTVEDSPVETWHYNCGTGRFKKVLTFIGETLARIVTTKEYGSGMPRCN